jgi:hypothetical protein
MMMNKMIKHHKMCGPWLPPGYGLASITAADSFNDSLLIHCCIAD